MLKKLFSSGNVTTSNTSNTHRSCSSQHKSKQENNRSNAQPSTNNKKEIGLEDKTSFLALLTQLEDFEDRVRRTVTILSRHCQALTDLSSSMKEMELIVPTILDEDKMNQISSENENNSSGEIEGQIAKFRSSVIAPMQALLAGIPQLKLKCEHRKSALNIVLRYQQKIDHMGKSCGSRLQRNRAKLHAASSRFKDLDESIRSDMNKILNTDIRMLVRESLAKLSQSQNKSAQWLQFLTTSFSNEQQIGEKSKSPKTSSSTSGTQNQTRKPNQRENSAATEPAISEREESGDYTQEALDAFPLHADSPLPPPPTVIEDHQQQQQSLGPIIQILPKHVLDEEHSLCPKKKHAHGTRTWKLHQYIKDSMANGLDVIDCVRLPEGCLVEEWIAVHVIDFFNEISLLFGTINEFCTVDSCAEMSAGPCYTYLWADSSHPTPVSLPATQYVTRLMHWIEAQLADTSLFPNMEQKFDTNPEFMNVSKVILKRLFRVYAHMYHNHLETFVALHAEAHLNFCFKRFICFIQEFALIEQKELNALKKLIMTLLPPSTSHNKKKTINKPFIS